MSCRGPAKTKKNFQAVLSAALTRTAEDGVIPANIAKGIHPPIGERRRDPVFLTHEEVEIIAGALLARYRLLAQFLEGPGSDGREATALEMRDVLQRHDIGDGWSGSVAVTKAWKNSLIGMVLGVAQDTTHQEVRGHAQCLGFRCRRGHR